MAIVKLIPKISEFQNAEKGIGKQKIDFNQIEIHDSCHFHSERKYLFFLKLNVLTPIESWHSVDFVHSFDLSNVNISDCFFHGHKSAVG